jgi:hypothetical protein
LAAGFLAAGFFAAGFLAAGFFLAGIIAPPPDSNHQRLVTWDYTSGFHDPIVVAVGGVFKCSGMQKRIAID